MNVEDLKNISYWELVDLLNQWKANGRSLKCKDCKNCTTSKNNEENM